LRGSGRPIKASPAENPAARGRGMPASHFGHAAWFFCGAPWQKKNPCGHRGRQLSARLTTAPPSLSCHSRLGNAPQRRFPCSISRANGTHRSVPSSASTRAAYRSGTAPVNRFRSSATTASCGIDPRQPGSCPASWLPLRSTSTRRRRAPPRPRRVGWSPDAAAAATGARARRQDRARQRVAHEVQHLDRGKRGQHRAAQRAGCWGSIIDSCWDRTLAFLSINR
jgi:hypothetical protein